MNKQLTYVLAFSFAALALSHTVQAQSNKLQWHTMEEALSIAEKANKPIFVDVWAPWCGWCRRMKKEVYPKVSPELNDFVLARLNRDDNDSTVRYENRLFSPLKLAQEFKANTVPAMVILSHEGGYLMHLTGYTPAESLKPILRYIASGSYRDISYRDFLEKGNKP